MTFKHKLSCRLALLRNVVLLGAVCFIAACDLQQLLGLLARVASPRDSSGNALVARVVTWASTAPAVATVSGGLVTGVAAGPATITATSEGQSGVAAVTVMTVTAAPVAYVTVSPAAAGVSVGQTVQLVATPKDASGNTLTGRVVTWGSNAPAVATVNSNGLVTGVAAGAAAITATSEGQSGSAAISVTAAVTAPAKVTDLAVTGVTTNGLTLAFTEVTDGAGQPAKYDFRYAVGAIAFGSATNVAQGTCVRPVNGTSIGAPRSCTILGLTAATSYQVQLVSYRGTLDVDAVFGPLSNVASGTTAASTAPVATVTVSPASASVAVGAVQQFTATLRDASGNVLTGRAVAWSSSSPTIAGVSGTGLVSGLVAGPATLTATSEGQSGTATITVTLLPPPSGGVIFESEWASGEPSDGGRWTHYWEFNNGTGINLLSVLPGFGPGGRNALKVIQRGPNLAGSVQKDGLPNLSTDYYVRFYMRNDDISSTRDHGVTPDIYRYQNLTYIAKSGAASGWQYVMSMFGVTWIYPLSYMGPALELAHGVWYRFEYFVDYVDATHVQVHPRVYDAAGTLILSDADFRQSDYGMASWNGRSDWTLDQLYATGFAYAVVPDALTSFAVGNNGQAGSFDTGLAWYFAGVQVRTDRWPGP